MPYFTGTPTNGLGAFWDEYLPKPEEKKPAATATPAPKTDSGVFGFIKDVLTGGAKAYGAGLAQKGQQPGVAYRPPSAVEKYLPYIVIGGGLVIIAVVLKGKKKK
ncbi:MAG: hypothetical protein ACYSWU_00075 [Planctomycetota bacterium]|jgi:hypothetical protein